MRGLLVLVFLLVAALPAQADAQDGYGLWLRYRPVEAEAQQQYARGAQAIVARYQLKRYRRAPEQAR